jgi:hypothetical protein
MYFKLDPHSDTIYLPSIPDSQPNVSQTLQAEFDRERAIEQSSPDWEFRDGLLTIRLFNNAPDANFLNQTVHSARQRFGRDSLAKIVVMISNRITSFETWFRNRGFHRDIPSETGSGYMLAYSKEHFSPWPRRKP